MPQVSKFLFETDFAEPESERADPNKAEEEDGVEAPVFSEAELLSAREHGYEAGIAAGQAQALAGVEKQSGDVIADIGAKLDGIGEQIAAQKALTENDVAVLANAIATKISGAAPDEARVEMLERLVSDCVSNLYQAPEVVARVPADLEEALKSRLAMSKTAIAVTVVPDQALTGTDCQLAWQGGGAERSEADIAQQVDALLEQYLSGQSTDHTEVSETAAATAGELPAPDPPVEIDNEAAAEAAADDGDAPPEPPVETTEPQDQAAVEITPGDEDV